MHFKEKLEKEQEIAYKTLYNSFSNGKISHAYLISGSKGSPLKETALFIAKSLICKEDTLACEECLDCRKIKSRNYADLKFVNEKGGNILKDDVESLKEEFSLTAMEENGKKIYIIHLIENANAVAINRLLKFIEEPSDDIYGILTTENLSKVLQTIISRCQLIRLKPSNKEDLISELMENYDEETSRILASFSNNIDEVNDLVDNCDVHKIIDLASETIDKILTDQEGLIYFVSKEVETIITDRKQYHLYFGILQYFIKKLMFEDKYKNFKDWFNNILNEIMLQDGKLESNMNLNLLVDQLFINILRKGGFIEWRMK